MNGFEFANEALSVKNYELDTIIKLTDGAEVDWLEFKAAIKGQNAKETSESNEYDFILHLLKALVSMANGSGGMVLLGVDDEMLLDSNTAVTTEIKINLRVIYRTKCLLEQVGTRSCRANGDGRIMLIRYISIRNGQSFRALMF